MTKDRYRGLTKGDARALKALGVEALGKDEESFIVRVRTSAETRMLLKNLSPKELGEAIERGLETSH